MPLPCSFSGDLEFSKLIGYQRSVSMTQTALEIARDARPRLDFETTHLKIAALADDVRGAVIKARNDVQSLEAFCQTMAETYGFGGNTGCFERAESSYIDRVVDTRRGIPISLAMVYMAVAEQLGMPMAGVAAPAHFLCRFDTDRGPLFVDAFGGGKIHTEESCLKWLADLSGLPAADIRPTLQPAMPRTVILRLLNNLKSLHLRKNDWTHADQVLRRLLALRPKSFVDRRDLASVSLMLGRPGRVVELFSKERLEQLSNEEREAADELLVSAWRMIAACN